MLALIKIKKLTIPVILGTGPHERTHKQKIILDLSFQYNAKKAIAGDDLAQAVDYECLVNTLIKEVSSTKFFLAEKLADFILHLILKNPKILSAEVKLYKPGAVKNAQGIFVCLTQKKSA